MSLIEVKNLRIYDIPNQQVIVDDLNFKVEKNSCLGIVGESGSGKSISVKAILGLLGPELESRGSVKFNGVELLHAEEDLLRKIRGRHFCMILQDAMTAFDPLYTIGAQFVETLCETIDCTKAIAKKTALASLQKMRIHDAEEVLKKYPHQLSGGMLQRCMIGLAMALKPEVIIADEPTTALDSINQREILEEFKRLQALTGVTLIFISHDLGIIEYLADDVLVMYQGNCVEFGTAQQVFRNPKHEYSKYLMHTRIALTKAFHQSMVKE
ncbi:ABC transporter ATP-binding protein [Anaerosinus massiliensis]|uniref:ABC transporter ATP-binding protein n=1 Tax=Massilibacillus massiliensis TaxID=1806837 RepID=UPI000AD5372A|nr:ABC transporter ATP-binding protein [Massilibacillus massiliensis]